METKHIVIGIVALVLLMGLGVVLVVVVIPLLFVVGTFFIGFVMSFLTILMVSLDSPSEEYVAQAEPPPIMHAIAPEHAA